MAETFEIVIFLFVFLIWVVRAIASVVGGKSKSGGASPQETAGDTLSTRDLLEELSRAAGQKPQERSPRPSPRSSSRSTARRDSAPSPGRSSSMGPPRAPTPPPRPLPREKVKPRSQPQPGSLPPPLPRPLEGEGLGAGGPLIQDSDGGQIAAAGSSSLRSVEMREPRPLEASVKILPPVVEEVVRPRGLAASVRRDLQSGPRAAARAVLLAEVFGPPPALIASRGSGRRPGDP